MILFYNIFKIYLTYLQIPYLYDILAIVRIKWAKGYNNIKGVVMIMENKEFLQILKNIYGALTYDDWVHAKEYVKLEIKKLEENINSVN